MKKLVLLFLSVFILDGCNSQPDAKYIVDKAIMLQGGDIIDSAIIKFDFRNRHYTYNKRGKSRVYVREFTNKSNEFVSDTLSNGRVRRFVNDEEFILTEEMSKKYSESINSVIYFALLPYFLNDKAAIKELIGEGKINNEDYYKIKVTFNKEGGGEDYSDIFVYWLNKRNFRMDYLAYYYFRNESGNRFRKQINFRKINGVLFADSENYTNESLGKNISELDEYYSTNKLSKVSDIILKNVYVEKLGDN